MFILGLLLVVIVGSAPGQTGSLPAASSRIVGGLPANSFDFPFVVSLVTQGYHACGGSIINRRTVITAAHCLEFTTPRLMKVHVGTKSRALHKGMLVPVEAIHGHELWTENTMDYDIGLVRLAKDLVFGATVQPIQLPQPNDDDVRFGTLATVAGWGFLTSIGPQAEELQAARVPIFNQMLCNLFLDGRVTKRMICAGYEKGGIDACQMDSGGPLVIQKKLIGITSWGIGCALPNKPGVYTRVSALMPWVRELLASEYNESI